MAGISGKGVAGDRFATVTGKRVALLSPVEQEARGLIKAIEDAKLACDRCVAAANAQTARAEAYTAQIEALTAQLGALDADA